MNKNKMIDNLGNRIPTAEDIVKEVEEDLKKIKEDIKILLGDIDGKQ